MTAKEAIRHRWIIKYENANSLANDEIKNSQALQYSN